MNFNSRKGIAGYPTKKIIQYSLGIFALLVLLVVAFVMKDMLFQKFLYKEEKYKVFNSVEALRFAIDVTAAGKVPEEIIIGPETPKEEACDNDNCCKQDYGYCYEYCTIGGSPDCSTKGSKESHCISQYDLVGSVPVNINVNGVSGTCRWDCESDEEDIDLNNKGGLNFCVKKDDCLVYYSQDACNEHSDKCKYEIDFTTGEGTCVPLSPTGSFLSKITGMATSDVKGCGAKNCGINPFTDKDCEQTQKCKTTKSGRKCIEDAACIEHAQGTEMPPAEELSLYPNGLGGGCKFIEENDEIHAWCDYYGYFGDEDDKEVLCKKKEFIMNKINEIADELEEKLNADELACCYKESAGIGQYKIIAKGILGFDCESGWTQLYQTKNNCINRLREGNPLSRLPEGYEEVFSLADELKEFGDGKFKCNVIKFELPQEISKAEDWILGYGDPQFLVYWQDFPSGEDESWGSFGTYTEDVALLLLIAMPAGSLTGKVVKTTKSGIKGAFKTGQDELAKATDSVVGKIASKLGIKRTDDVSVVLVEKGAPKATVQKTLGEFYNKKLTEFGVETVPRTAVGEAALAKVVFTKVLKVSGTYTKKDLKRFMKYAGAGTVGAWLAARADSQNAKYEKHSNSLLLKMPYQDPKIFSLSDNAKEHIVILDKAHNFNSLFYYASPCVIDLEVKKTKNKDYCKAGYRYESELHTCELDLHLEPRESNCPLDGTISENDCNIESIIIKDAYHEYTDQNFCFSSAEGAGYAIIGASLVVDAAVIYASAGFATQLAVGITTAAVSWTATHSTKWPGHFSLAWH